jgi:uncharacterized repeat protein (TIGR03803 family)
MKHQSFPNRSVLRFTAFVALVLAAGAARQAQAQAPTFTVLHSFTNSPDGASPFGGLLRDAAGKLYGTTLGGGCTIYGCGIVFKLDPASNETVLYRLGSVPSGLNPQDPYAALVMDAAGNLYGTTRDSGAFGNGTVFRLDTSGTFTVLHSFAPSEGAGPYAGVVLDAAGNLYGTTGSAASVGVLGTVFDTAGNFTVLHFFTGSDGCSPSGGVIMDAAGNFYGTAGGCGAFGQGTVFKLDRLGNVTVLYSFKGGSDGSGPTGGLTMDAAGNLYGTTVEGGGSDPSGTCGSQTGVGGCGTVFKVDPSGNETVLYSFKGRTDGAFPYYERLVMDAAGNLYGTTNVGGSGPCTGRNQVVVGCGTVFKLDPAGNETVLYSFTGGSDGAFPYAGLVMDTTGNLYGTASSFLALGGFGTVFKLAVQTLQPPTITSMSSTSAIAGDPAFTLTVNGTNFVSGSTVSFSGNARATTFVSATQLMAAILASDIAIAGTFNVTVTNAGGGTSNVVSFVVLTPQQATQAVVNSVNALFSQGVLNGGQDNSLVMQLQHAITMMNAGKNAGAVGNLQSFISEVNDLLSSGVLSPSQAASLVSAAESVIAALP